MDNRWLGAVLVIFGCGGLGILLASRYCREMDQLRQLNRILACMISELQCRVTPLPDLCRIGAEQGSGAVKKLFETIAGELECQIAPNAACCVEAAADRIPELSASCRKLAVDMGGMMGRFDLTGQLQALEMTKNSCSLQLKEMEHDQKQRLRTYKTLGFCTGVALAILLF